jgi:predicted AlkP superfamily pyrophosphatase or phosphodiesterase
MADAHYNHVPLHTGPGHATIMTGAAPRSSGIIGNSWHTSAGLSINCVGDPDADTIGVPPSPTRRGSFSPKNLLAETVGDALKLANNRQSKVVGLGIKDRGAILPTGHNADAAVWFDSTYGKWVTSTWYTTSTLPQFAQRANDNKVADRWIGSTWDYLLPPDAYKVSMPEGREGVGAARGLSATFPKQLSTPGAAPDRDYYNHMIFTPYGNEMVFETAKLAVEHEQLGQDIYPDILSVSFSTTDLIGHSWGPHSPEMQDTIIRADRQVSNFLNFLEVTVPGGLDNVTIVLTGDHGAAPIPEWSHEMKFPAARVLYEDIVEAAEATLAQAYPDKQTTGILLFADPYLRFRAQEAMDRGIDIDAAAELIAKALPSVEGISVAYTRKQIESGALPHTAVAQAVTNGFNPKRSGDIVVLSEQFYYNSTSKTGTTHGTTFTYDTHMPCVFVGRNIKPGVYTQRSDIRDIAPTLAFLLGLSAPASSEGRILSEIIK